MHTTFNMATRHNGTRTNLYANYAQKQARQLPTNRYELVNNGRMQTQAQGGQVGLVVLYLHDPGRLTHIYIVAEQCQRWIGLTDHK